MNTLKILITGAGAPGIKGTIFSLIHNYVFECNSNSRPSAPMPK